jgi:predicted NUDIX family phosphoesterase
MSESKIDKNDVEILAVRASALFPVERWTGFRATTMDAVLTIINAEGEYIKRGLLETDPSYKQVIPQLLWVCEGKVFVHRIPKSGSEARLHNQMPIFLGGHVEKGEPSIESATWREFFEETGIPDSNACSYKREFIGMVNDETNDVSQVHFGLVSIVRGPDLRDLSRTDEGVSEGAFWTPDQVDTIQPSLTYWSRLAWPLIKHLV